MASTKVVLNLAGFRQLRTDPAVVRDLNRRAAAIAASAGDGYEASDPDETKGRTRARAAVFTGDADSMVDNARHNSLIRALDAGRR